MLLSACDAVPRTYARIPVRLPPVSGVATGESAVVGTVRDTRTRAALTAVVLRFQGPRALSVQTDSVGGFLAERLAPGAYRVLVTRIGYDVVTDTLRLMAGVVDTVHYRLRYRSCP